MAQVTEFGVTAQGQVVHKITLTAGDLTASVLTLGGILQSVRLAGVPFDLTHGSDLVTDYQSKMRHHGSLVGPVGNRFTNAKAPIAGVMHSFAANQNNTHTLHSGPCGTQFKVWALSETTETSATLTLTLPDGEGGFPGTRHVAARFSVTAPATLTMEVTVTTDKTTLVNFCNHSYWNLDGSADWSGHALQVAADRYMPTTLDFTPTGETPDVTGTEYDFREMREISVGHPLFDNNFCLSDSRVPLRDVLWLRGKSGLQMTIATTEPGIQVYDGRNAIRPGRAAHEGLAIEAQGWPDAPNHTGFPSIELAPGETYQQITRWRFAQT